MTSPGNPSGGSETLSPAAFGLAIGVGLAGALGASAFLALVHAGQHALFVSIPESIGLEAAPAWWSGIVLLTGALLVSLAYRLPGHAGPGPLTGFHFATPLAIAPGVLLTALASLMFGFVLGPEAPLIVLGSTIGVLATRRAPARTQAFAGLLGGVAAIGAVFGNPFVTAFMVLEIAAMGAAPAAVLMPALVALGSGYLLQVGVGEWTGLGLHPLSVTGLPAYDAAQPADLAIGLVVAVVAAGLAALTRQVGIAVERVSASRRMLAPFGAAAVILAALVVGSALGVTQDDILFSGQGDGMASLIAESSVGVVAAIVILKGIAYAASLGGGFRGGPIFPATFLGVGIGVLAALIVPASSVSAMAAVGIAATSTVMTRLVFTSGLLAMMLVGGAGTAVAPMAIMGAVIGFIVRQALDRRAAEPEESVS